MNLLGATDRQNKKAKAIKEVAKTLRIESAFLKEKSCNN